MTSVGVEVSDGCGFYPPDESDTEGKILTLWAGPFVAEIWLTKRVREATVQPPFAKPDAVRGEGNIARPEAVRTAAEVPCG